MTDILLGSPSRKTPHESETPRNLKWGEICWAIFTDICSVTANFVLIILPWQLSLLPQPCLDFAAVSTENQTPTGESSQISLGALSSLWGHFLNHQIPAPLSSSEPFSEAWICSEGGHGLNVDSCGAWSTEKVSSHLPCPTNMNRFGCLGVLPSFWNHEVLFLDWMFLLTLFLELLDVVGSHEPAYCAAPI